MQSSFNTSDHGKEQISLGCQCVLNPSLKLAILSLEQNRQDLGPEPLAGNSSQGSGRSDACLSVVGRVIIRV